MKALTPHHQEKARKLREHNRRMEQPGYRERVQARTRLRRYGISQEVFDQMVTDQGGRCAICRKKKVELCVDHDHQSGVVRGLLCHKCNTALGALHESPVILQRAINYLMEVKG